MLPKFNFNKITELSKRKLQANTQVGICHRVFLLCSVFGGWGGSYFQPIGFITAPSHLDVALRMSDAKRFKMFRNFTVEQEMKETYK